ncbi:hypothetical protein MERGE_002182 [Pneumocystis wakefieldiae]|uniref:ubiquitinyl hydrolase 1 n=1 Tax=Pneumocystis wakefieldiae TaxID=38082 RepID=A0A899G0K8_9ASCO|nr:hypothetical protein MERGE_002182 [Pneumocystis wakefieldiae]
MTTIPIYVKWQGKRFDLEVQIMESILVLKSQLYSLTGVPCERQKILGLGRKQVKDDAIFQDFNVKPYSTIMLLGSTEAQSEISFEQPVFLEDTSGPQIHQKLSLPSGLKNLGNTCYMNSTLQMLKSMPELELELEKVSQDKTRKLDKSGTIIESLSDVFRNMNVCRDFSPLIFLGCLRIVFPQFAERDKIHGRFCQQDAEECWSQLIQNLRTHLPMNGNSPSFVNKYMVGTLINEIKCCESEDEPPVTSNEDFIKLNCHIGMNTNYMIDEILNKEATFVKVSKISRLPKYLTINFVRFFWKLSIRKKVKILRKVKFPFELDICEFCEDNLKSKLIPVRDILRNINKNLEEKETIKKKSLNEMIKELWKLVDIKSIDEGSNVSGLYNLIGILTHSGGEIVLFLSFFNFLASADSGHYQAWIRIPNSSEWCQFNDDNVTIVPRSKIETLDGGSENDTAYIALYSAMELPTTV